MIDSPINILALLILLGVGAYGFYWSWMQKNKVISESDIVALSHNSTPDTRQQAPVEDINTRLERYMNEVSEPGCLYEKNEDIVLCIRQLDKKPIILPSSSRRQHVQILGPTGCGKSMLAQTLIAQDLMNPNVSIFVLEPKGGNDALVYQMKHLAHRLRRKTYLIDPTNPETFIILPLYGDDLDEVAENNVSAFLMYLGNQADQFYKNKQETALRMAVKVAKVVKGNEATYDDLLDILRHSPHGALVRKEYIRMLSDPRFSYIKRDLEEYDYELVNNPRAGHYYSGLIDYLKKLTSNQYLRNILCVPPSKATGRAINLHEVLDNAGVILVTTAVHTTKHLGYTIGRLYLSMLQSEMFHRMRSSENKCPVACYIDEVQNYVSEAFAEAFEMGRSANFMITVIHHNLEQLRENSKRLEQSVFTNARQKVVFGGINAEDAERIASQVGQAYQLSVSYGYHHNEQFIGRKEENMYIGQKEELKWVITPAEIMKLPGFNPKTGEPAQVLCLLNIDNKPSYVYGLVYPVALDYLKPLTDQEEGDSVRTVFDEDIVPTKACELVPTVANVSDPQQQADTEQKTGVDKVISSEKRAEESLKNKENKRLKPSKDSSMEDILTDLLLRKQERK